MTQEMPGPAKADKGDLEAHHPAKEIVREWRKAWRPGLAALIGGALSYSIWPSVSSLFVQPLQNAFGWSRGEISFAANSGIVAAFLAPTIGRLVDRLGVRPVLITGLILTAFSYGLLSMVTGILHHYYVVYLIFALCGMMTTGITYTRVVTGAFHKTRGSALAISRSGLALSSAFLPILLYNIICNWGYVGGYLTLSALILMIALPLAWLWIPARTVPPDNAHFATDQFKRQDRWTSIILRPKVMFLCLAGSLNYAPVVALLSQLMPLAESKGITAGIAVGAISTVGVAAFAGSLISGLLVDRFWAPAVAFVLNIVPAMGCLLLLSDQLSFLAIYAAAILIGLGQGAEIDILAFMVARYFGLRNYATIYGVTVLAIGVFTSASVSAIGTFYDQYGNYNFAIGMASASFAIAACCYLLMGRYPKAPPE